MREYFLFEMPLIILACLAVVFIVHKRARAFWPVLVVVNLIGNGPRVFGYNFADELLTLCAAIAAFSHLSARDFNFRDSKFRNWRNYFFIAWIIYMVVESVIGIAVNSDLRIIRWVILYLILALLFLVFIFGKEKLPFPGLKSFSTLAVVTSIVYFAVYLLQGIYYEKALGEWGRFTSQYLTKPFIWSGTATAVFPIFIALPAAIYLLRERALKLKLLAWSVITLMIYAGFYYDSRIAFVLLGLGAVLLLFLRRIRELAFYAGIFALIFCAFVPHPAKEAPGFVKNLVSSATVFYKPVVTEPQVASRSVSAPAKDSVKEPAAACHVRDGDSCRTLQLEAALARSISNPKTFFLGDGMYSHRFTLSPYIYSRNKAYLSSVTLNTFLTREQEAKTRKEESERIVRTTAFSALLVDTGIIGILLLMANFYFTARKIVFEGARFRPVFLVMLFVVFMWMFVNNISDVVFIYLLIIPEGLLDQVSGKFGAKLHSTPANPDLKS